MSEDMQEVLGLDVNVFENLAEKTGRYVSAFVVGDCRYSTIGVTKLLMGSALANFREPELPERRDHLTRLQHRQFGHANSLR